MIDKVFSNLETTYSYPLVSISHIFIFRYWFTDINRNTMALSAVYIQIIYFETTIFIPLSALSIILGRHYPQTSTGHGFFTVFSFPDVCG